MKHSIPLALLAVARALTEEGGDAKFTLVPRSSPGPPIDKLCFYLHLPGDPTYETNSMLVGLVTSARAAVFLGR